MGVLYWLESIRNPVLDAIMLFITRFGEETVFLLIALTVFWCASKREGYYLLFVGFFGTVLNQFLKLACRVPRPFVRDPQFSAVEAAKNGAGGYSFPSGHTQSVAGTLGGIARWHKNARFRVACICLLLLTAFSRMYLGVHTPQDVLVSLCIASVLIFALYPLINRAANKPARMYLLLGVMCAISFAFVCYANFSSFPANIDAANLEEAQKNSYSLFGALLGFVLGYSIEHRYIRFEEKAVWWVQILKVVGGLALLLLCKEGLKLLFSAVGWTWVGTSALRYFATVLAAACVWPLTFPRLNALSGKRETA
ncbi:MAG: phosphatase PAP2 family protein [Oscillospiraceae bacterium]|nr:phosphatase PAP2 family protein [Oscillospiraceae bacterium]